MPGRDGDRSATGASFERHLRAAFTERLGYKAAALFFALVLWLVVSAEEPSEELVPVRLEADFDSSRSLAAAPPVIRALVAGRARDLIKLYDTPPVVRRTITDDEPDSVAVELTPADVYVPPDVDAIVRDVQPRSFVLVFDVTASRQVPIKNEVRVEPDSSGGDTPPVVRIVPESAIVTGPRRVISKVASVSTKDGTVAVSDSADFMIPLDVAQFGNAVKVRPPEVRLSVLRPSPERKRDTTRPGVQPRR